MPRRSKVELALQMQHRLTPRDWRLLGWLYDHRLLTTDQIADALYPSVHAAQARLKVLTGYGLLLRFQPPAPGRQLPVPLRPRSPRCTDRRRIEVRPAATIRPVGHTRPSHRQQPKY